MIKIKEMIPKEVALKLCEQVRMKLSKKKISIWKTQCHFCKKFSDKKNDQTHLCIFAREDNRGCP